MSDLLFALAAAMLATTASAQAVDAKDEPAPAPAPALVPDTKAATPDTKPQRYCVKGTMTGTRIVQKTCMTREEWLDMGFDPLKPDG